MFVWNTYPLMGLPQASVSIPDYIDRKTQAPAIEDATLFTMRSGQPGRGRAAGAAARARGHAVVLHDARSASRSSDAGFTEDEAKPDADKFVILTYGSGPRASAPIARSSDATSG